MSYFADSENLCENLDFNATTQMQFCFLLEWLNFDSEMAVVVLFSDSIALIIFAIVCYSLTSSNCWWKMEAGRRLARCRVLPDFVFIGSDWWRRREGAGCWWSLSWQLLEWALALFQRHLTCSRYSQPASTTETPIMTANLNPLANANFDGFSYASS